MSNLKQSENHQTIPNTNNYESQKESEDLQSTVRLSVKDSQLNLPST